MALFYPYYNLVGGLEHEFYLSIYWEESSQLTFIFFGGLKPPTSINKVVPPSVISWFIIPFTSSIYLP